MQGKSTPRKYYDCSVQFDWCKNHHEKYIYFFVFGDFLRYRKYKKNRYL